MMDYRVSKSSKFREPTPKHVANASENGKHRYNREPWAIIEEGLKKCPAVELFSKFNPFIAIFHFPKDFHRKITFRS